MLARAGAADKIGRVRGVGAELVSVNGNELEAVARLRASSAVDYAEVDKILTAASVPNDTQFSAAVRAERDQGAPGLGPRRRSAPSPRRGESRSGSSTRESTARTPSSRAGSRTAPSPPPSLASTGRYARGCDDDDGHGTKVAGILSANANNGLGTAGVAFNSPLAVCRALEDGLGRGSTSNVVNCLGWLRSKGAKVISMSFGGASSTTLQNAVTKAWNNGYGAVLLAAAGNDGGYGTLYPAGYPEVISVTATDATDGWASANHNDDVEVAAPGDSILTTTMAAASPTARARRRLRRTRPGSPPSCA